jgi:hypothetical protein
MTLEDVISASSSLILEHLLIALPRNTNVVIARRRSRRGNPLPPIMDRHAASKAAMTRL